MSTRRFPQHVALPVRLSALMILVALTGGCSASDAGDDPFAAGAGGNPSSSGNAGRTGVGGSLVGSGGQVTNTGSAGAAGYAFSSGGSGPAIGAGAGGMSSAGGPAQAGQSSGFGGTPGTGGQPFGFGGSAGHGGRSFGTGGSVGSAGQSSGGAGGTSSATWTEIYTKFLSNDQYASNCNGSACHNPGKQKGYDFSTKANGYSSVKNSTSQFVSELSSGGMPKGKPKMPAADLAVIKAWVAAGAQNN
jgi:hypothetical protein